MCATLLSKGTIKGELDAQCSVVLECKQAHFTGIRVGAPYEMSTRTLLLCVKDAAAFDALPHGLLLPSLHGFPTMFNHFVVSYCCFMTLCSVMSSFYPAVLSTVGHPLRLRTFLCISCPVLRFKQP